MRATLGEIVVSVMGTRPMCYLMPTLWSQYESCVRLLMRSYAPGAKDRLFGICHMNGRFTSFHTQFVFCQYADRRARAIDALDNGVNRCDLQALFENVHSMLKYDNDFAELITDWSCSSHRQLHAPPT